MIITIKEFEAYEQVRKSGVTNMFNINLVSELSGLTKEQIKYMMIKYTKLKKELEDEL